MANEEEKIDIEDIKDPDSEELDLDKVVSEEPADEKEEEAKSPVKEEEVLEKTPVKETPAVLEAPVKARRLSGSKKNLMKYLIIGGTILLLGIAGTLGAMYYLQQKNKAAEVADTAAENSAVEEKGAEEAAPVVEAESLYVSSEVGLNLRETPNTKAAVLAIIPYGTKITVIEKQTGWVKTTFEGKTGWVSADFTQATDPLVYANTTYGFGLTFKPDWAGYKFIEYKHQGSTTLATYYVCLPTTDKVWDETMSGIPKGYASLFVMGIYTKAEWTKQAGGEMLPAKLGESDKYVYTYLPGQAFADGLGTQYGEVKDIIKTFELLK